MSIGLVFRVTEVQLSDLHQLAGNLHERIERSHRILKDHRDAPPSNLAHLFFAQSQNVNAIKEDFSGNNFARWLGNQAYDREISDGFT
jgi:hypothetical protein